MNIYIFIIGGLFALYGLLLLIFDRKRRAATDFYLRKHPWVIVLIGVAIVAGALVSQYLPLNTQSGINI